MMADQQMSVPPHIVTTRLRPDMLLWLDLEKMVYFIELTVPWEDQVEEANELKKAEYPEMAGAAQRGWSMRLRPNERGGSWLDLLLACCLNWETWMKELFAIRAICLVFFTIGW